MNWSLQYLMDPDVQLVIAALITSTISGFMGMLGGILLLVFMGGFFPPAVLIPMHGIVQLGSNGARSLINFPHVDKKLALLFAVGVVCGAAIGSQVVVVIPENLYRVVLAIFILMMTWMPKWKNSPSIPGKFYFLGLVASFLSLFIGATGPFLAPFFLREKLDRLGIVATKAACQTFVHLAKVIAFMGLGFSVGPHWKLLAVMILATFIGNYFGKKLLGKVPEGLFRIIFRVVITVLAVRMLL